MFAERPLPQDIDGRIEALARAWSTDAGVAALYLFGSRAAGRPGARSDVDLAVVLREGLDADARWSKRLQLLGDTCRRLGTDAVGGGLVRTCAGASRGGRRVARGGPAQ